MMIGNANILGSRIIGGDGYLLDTYSFLTHCYAMIRLSKDTVYAVRLRRTLDNAESDFTPEELLDGTAEAWTSGTNGAVVTWYNQVPGSIGVENLANGTTSTQPFAILGGVLQKNLGVPCLYTGAGDNKKLNGGKWADNFHQTGSTDSYFFTVRNSVYSTPSTRQTLLATYTTFNDPGYFIEMNTDSNYVLTRVENNAGVVICSNTASTTININDTYLISDLVSITNAVDSEKSDIWVNGTSFKNNANTGSPDAGTSANGVQVIDNSNNYYFRGKITIQGWGDGGTPTDRAAFEADVNALVGL